MKEIIKSFNNIERRITNNTTATDLANKLTPTTTTASTNAVNATAQIITNLSANYEKYFKQQMQAHQTHYMSQSQTSQQLSGENSTLSVGATHVTKEKGSDAASLPSVKSDKFQAVNTLNNKAKLLASNIAKMKMSSSFIQNGK